MPFAEFGARLYPLRVPGNIRSWSFGGGDGNTTGLLITNPVSILVDVFGTFAAGTVTLQFSTNNSTWVALAAPIAFTASGEKLVAPADVKTGFYRFTVTGGSGATLDITANLIATSSTDVV